ncbi:hypothetical protein Glove_87g171 [Diversispora epigaea]|uniref:Uncharacterized protein n=1 Tax=Diversispora epigaea TaxID=1348612 RepID=A0A397JF28_9GLOM|nr:hypothetical protein Glove_87g171 [Diversispora epigaea]
MWSFTIIFLCQWKQNRKAKTNNQSTEEAYQEEEKQDNNNAGKMGDLYGCDGDDLNNSTSKSNNSNSIDNDNNSIDQKGDDEKVDAKAKEIKMNMK